MDKCGHQRDVAFTSCCTWYNLLTMYGFFSRNQNENESVGSNYDARCRDRRSLGQRGQHRLCILVSRCCFVDFRFSNWLLQYRILDGRRSCRASTGTIRWSSTSLVGSMTKYVPNITYHLSSSSSLLFVISILMLRNINTGIRSTSICVHAILSWAAQLHRSETLETREHHFVSEFVNIFDSCLSC